METENITLEIPIVFGKLCREYYKLDPHVVGSAIIYDFCLTPPRGLTLIASEPPAELCAMR